MSKTLMILSIAMTTACAPKSQWEGSLESLLFSQPDRFATVMQDPEKYRVQITNENQTFNDDNYEYEEIGQPFLKNLGQAIYEIELNRPRQHQGKS